MIGRWLRERREEPAWGSDEIGRVVKMGLDSLRAESLSPQTGIEHLRRRILAESLRGAPRTPWAWSVPAAASLFLLAYWLAGSVRSSQPVPVLERPVASAPNEPLGIAGPEEVPRFPESATHVRPDRAVQFAAVARADREERRGPTNLVSVEESALVRSDAAALAAQAAQEGPALIQEEQAALSAQTEDGDEEQIVLINNTEDTETGAAAAVELETSANVLVGG
ncbi:MAG: hypothetical protein N2109_01230 [Fimbriimonadales bacterium]|nr:hypothetical protein [Fimbriimonadales bacterium]